MFQLPFGIQERIINNIVFDYLNRIEDKLVLKDTASIDSAESSKVLTVYLSHVIKEVLDYVHETDKAVEDRVGLCNSVINHIINCIENNWFSFKNDDVIAKKIKGFLIHQDAEILLAYLDKKRTSLTSIEQVIRPTTSIAESSLFTGAVHEPSLVTELKKEIMSCNRIDLLISFIRWSGLRLIINELGEFSNNGGSLRIITTSYLGATDFKAIEQLAKLPNTEIRISYNTKRTRLHAKSYLFWRDTGFSVVYIGSSNVSESAMTSGLEWNVKLSEYDSKDIITKMSATFEGYWNSAEFIKYIPGIDSERLKKALKSERRSSQDEAIITAFNFDITPYDYQQEILDKLKAEREVHGFNKNLVIAATGTGKTVIAAFDYKNFCRSHSGKTKLLFVAHRKEILTQSLLCFRGILRDQNFGTIMVGREKPDNIEHLFVSIQSFNSKELTELTSTDFYDYIIIDEFHHAAAPSYQQLIDYYKPKILLGLTATPERADGKSIFSYFESRIAAEIRLYEAIERKLLSPFHYFGVTDSVNLNNVQWVYGKYDERELENLYVYNEAMAKKRVGYIFDAINRYCDEISDIIGIGFCATKNHAAYMANIFNNKLEIPSEYLVSETDNEIRGSVKERLVRKEINFVFVVDIYNEGVDIPEVNTVLFLRPTESLTVFLQQLGRGLRLSKGKDALTVLDFVGQAHCKFNFEDRFKALLPKTRKTIEQEVKTGFAHVPKGCSIQLERKAQEYILQNIKNSINDRRNLVRKLQDLMERKQELKVKEYFESYHVVPHDVYRKKITVMGLAAKTKLIKDYGLNHLLEQKNALAMGRLSFANSRRWIHFLQSTLPKIRDKKGNSLKGLNPLERAMLVMFHYTLWGKGLEDLENQFSSIEQSIYYFIRHKHVFAELMSLLDYQYAHIDIVDKPIANFAAEFPIDLYCTYTFDQILAAFGKHTEKKKSSFREGVLYLSEYNLDIFFVTINKSEKDYSPSTMYQDYSINDELFHWQSQSRTTIESVTGQRYIHQKDNNNNVLFFVREYKKENGFASPFTCIGMADYVNHYGSAPISIVWRMKEQIPGFVLKKTMKV